MAPLLHVLGGGPWQVPTVRTAKELGLRVLVTDMYAQRPAYALADHYEVIDITDRDATLEAARRHRIAGVICDTTDFGVPTAAFVAEHLGLPGIGYETALNFANKARMRARLGEAALTIPRYALVRETDGLAEAVDRVGLPLVMKPVDNQSGRGVGIVAEGREVREKYEYAMACSRSGVVLLESYVIGVEIIVDGIVVDGRCLPLSVARKAPYADNPTVSSRILYESDGSLPCSRQAVDSSCRATIAALGMQNGVFHAEFVVTETDIVPIDVAARGGGVQIYTDVVPHVSGVVVNRAAVKLAMGERVDVEPRAICRAAAIEFFRMPPGCLQQVVGVEEARRIDGIVAVHVNIAPGTVVDKLTHKDERLGYVIALGETTESVVAAALEAKSRLGVVVAGAAGPRPVL